jgi:DNA-binding MarR family transcriptional regulator
MKATALEELSFYIGRAYYNYKGMLERTLRDLRLDRHISPGMGHVLFTLFEEDSCIIRTIAERTRLSLPTITDLLQRMKRTGIVELRRDPHDGRAVRVRLTATGRSLRPRCMKALRRVNGILGAGLTAREVRAVKRTLAQMIESMRAKEDP